MKRKGATLSTIEGEVARKKRPIREIIREEIRNMMPHQVHDVKTIIEEHLQQGVDIGYLKTVLFPEQYSYDIPFPLSTISYCKFTNTQQVTLSSGPGGCGLAIWFPRVQGGYQLWVMNAQNPPLPGSGGIPLTTRLPSTSPNKNTSVWQLGLPQFSYRNFTQTALVAGSMSVQYVGSIESEKGYFVGGHIFGIDPEKLDIDDIENSQWVTRARPGEGLRFLHLPKDEADYQFYPCQKGASMNQGAGAVSYFSVLADAQISLDLSQTVPGTVSGVPAFALAGNKNLQTQTLAAADLVSVLNNLSGTSLGYVRNSNYVAFYWQGLEPNTDSIRVDCVRKYCAVPTSETRDIVELVRPARSFDSKRTFDVLNALCNTAPIGGHTLKEISTTIEPLIRYLPNAGYILQNGGFAQVNTLSELVGTLAGIDDEDKQLQGPLKPSLGRLYKLTL